MSKSDNIVHSATNLGSAVVESAQDGTLKKQLINVTDTATQALQGGVETATAALQSINPEDVTVDSLTEAFNGGGEQSVANLITSAGITASVGAVKSIFNQSGSIEGVYNHFFNKENTANNAKETFSLMSLLSDPGTMMDKLSSLWGKLQSGAAGWIDTLRGIGAGWADQIAGFLESAFSTLSSFLPSLGVGGQSDSSSQASLVSVAETGNNLSVQTAQNDAQNKVGLDGAGSQAPFETASAPPQDTQPSHAPEPAVQSSPENS